MLADPPAAYLEDATFTRGLRGWADAVVLPSTSDEVARVLAWCYEHDVPVVPRGGGTGYAGGAVPFGGVVVALERMRRVRDFEPLFWRIEVESGVTTWELCRLVRENGLMFPLEPGRASNRSWGERRDERRRAARVQVRRRWALGRGTRSSCGLGHNRPIGPTWEPDSA